MTSMQVEQVDVGSGGDISDLGTAGIAAQDRNVPLGETPAWNCRERY